MRAARREPLERTPVWFMRQAGRSLPEYRRLRERHGLFEINRSAELTAEVTLQPVRRHGVDAAVIFADIMTPVAAMGVEVELVEGVGPVVAEPIRTPRRRASGCACPTRARRWRRCSRRSRSCAPSSRPQQAVVGFCGGPVHRRRLPRRGAAVTRLRAHQVAHVPRARPSGTRCSRSSPTPSAPTRWRRPQRAPTSSSSSTPGSARSRRPTTASSPPLLGARARRAARGRRAHRSTSAPVPRRCSRRWPPPAAT